ncbi:MAG: LegC family aminotransferase [bacterium]|nr:LegC family aminotransferase [bacterium]
MTSPASWQHTHHSVAPRIPLSVPVMTGREEEYVRSCITDGFVSSVGPFVTRFEKEVAAIVGSAHAVATVNGTAALHLALLACGVMPGDAVLVPTYTFIATANAVRYCGAEPVFFDCNPETLCMDGAHVRSYFATRCVRKADGAIMDRETGRRVAAVLPVHVFGQPADLAAIVDAATSYGVPVVEDAAGAMGSRYDGRHVGLFGRVGCFSFNGNKIVTCGGGGAVVTNDERIATLVRHLSTQAKRSGIAYDHDAVGFNYRLTNIQAALGTAQLEQLDAKVERKRAIAARYRAHFASSASVRCLGVEQRGRANAWLMTVRVDPDTREGLLAALACDGIEARPAYIPLHTLPMYQMSPTFALEHATRIAPGCVNLPCSADLTDALVDRVAERVQMYCNERVVSSQHRSA